MSQFEGFTDEQIRDLTSDDFSRMEDKELLSIFQHDQYRLLTDTQIEAANKRMRERYLSIQYVAEYDQVGNRVVNPCTD